MSFGYGKISRKVTKQHKEYFTGKVGNIPVRGYWRKDGQDDICLFVDESILSFLSKKNEAKAEPEPAPQPEIK